MHALKNKKNWLFVAVGLLYVATHFLRLDALPVFADEAIYIRWAQLILSDPARYFFFPLNDGKTPLFIWSLVPFLKTGFDPLIMARGFSALVGMGQVVVVWLIIKKLGGAAVAQATGVVSVFLLPFWFFHHRIALMDGLLTLFISLTVFFLLSILSKVKKISTISLDSVVLLGGAGVSFGAALLTKTPAILALPSFAMLVFLASNISLKEYLQRFIVVGVASGIGLFIVSLLYFAPAFSQLFGRGSDFLYSPQEVLFEGKILETIANIPSYSNYFINYAGIFFLCIIVFGLFTHQYKRITHVFFWSGILFTLPIALLGQVVYPRYLFPAIFFYTIAASFALEAIVMTHVYKQKSVIKRTLASLVLALMIANTVATSVVFMAQAVFQPNNLRLVPLDRVQYLTEWSSGHGIYEAYTLITAASQTQTIAVGTEGYFGTLPDGLLLYFYGKNVDNLYIEGIGYPVGNIPRSFLTRSLQFDQQWLVVNSHRMNFNIDAKYLIAEYCRPFGAPCLQVWNLTEVLHDLPISD